VLFPTSFSGSLSLLSTAVVAALRDSIWLSTL
jgi:hypothetical protein